MKTNHWLTAAVVILAVALAAQSAYLMRLKSAEASDGGPGPYRVQAPAVQAPAVRQSAASAPRPLQVSVSSWDPFDPSGSWDPFEEMNQIRQTMNRMFHDSFDRSANGAFYQPKTDVEETGDAYWIRMDLPGIDKDKIQVKVQNGVLTLSGERQSEKEETAQNGGVYRMQRSFGSFLKSFPLPADADANALTAENKNGVLTIRLPKIKDAASAPAKNIPVQ